MSGVDREVHVVGYEFSNARTGHVILHHSHAGLFTEEKGYKARPLVYGDSQPNSETQTAIGDSYAGRVQKFDSVAAMVDDPDAPIPYELTDLGRALVGGGE